MKKNNKKTKIKFSKKTSSKSPVRKKNNKTLKKRKKTIKKTKAFKAKKKINYLKERK